MADAEIRVQKRRADRAALGGVVLMGLALLVSSLGWAPPLLTTAAAILGGGLLMYAVHLGWMMFVNRESDGPPS
jgi:hypothetical protein